MKKMVLPMNLVFLSQLNSGGKFHLNLAALWRNLKQMRVRHFGGILVSFVF